MSTGQELTRLTQDDDAEPGAERGDVVRVKDGAINEPLRARWKHVGRRRDPSEGITGWPPWQPELGHDQAARSEQVATSFTKSWEFAL